MVFNNGNALAGSSQPDNISVAGIAKLAASVNWQVANYQR